MKAFRRCGNMTVIALISLSIELSSETPVVDFIFRRRYSKRPRSHKKRDRYGDRSDVGNSRRRSYPLIDHEEISTVSRRSVRRSPSPAEELVGAPQIVNATSEAAVVAAEF